MPSYKRARVSPKKPRKFTKGSGRSGAKRRRTGPGPVSRALAGVSRLTRMIETKELTWTATVNQGIAHNDIYLFQRTTGVWNPFQSTSGNDDPMTANAGRRIGDSIAVRGLAIKIMFENALGRPKVYYRLMLLKCAKGDTPIRNSIFKLDSTNKMLDQINTERYTIVKQQIFNISTSNSAPLTVGVSGVVSSGTAAGIGSKLINWWIPGRKFGRDGIVNFENASETQVKFYDYRLVVVCYDWYGTPQDINDVGRVNEMYSKLYFKDA